ncbi:hypothetical protein WME75_24035 [Sorangium sp. So ce1014]|uniref:hypothetical protein n=1 Tax=Sorangium sp. So ce1014 TaxID=3133326 RepID=UPI003F5E3FFC
MATFLTTERMNPALTARVERAVSHGTRARHHAARSGIEGTLASGQRLGRARLLTLLTAVVIGLLAIAMYVHDRRTVEAERRALLTVLDERRAGLPAGHESFVEATDRWIGEAASDGDPADVVDPSLRAPGALDALLRRPAVYVRAPRAELRDARGIDDAARGSDKDAFLLCLMKPPPSPSERDRLTKVRGVYFGGTKVDEETANVRRLAEARLGLAALGPAFEGSVRAAPELSALRRLRKALEESPIELAKKAAGAEILIVVVESPIETETLASSARVSLVDLAAKKVLLRVGRRVDEQGLSPMGVLHREQIEGCGLALAVRRSVEEL